MSVESKVDEYAAIIDSIVKIRKNHEELRRLRSEHEKLREYTIELENALDRYIRGGTLKLPSEPKLEE